jgi:type I restriction enzyme S subunit
MNSCSTGITATLSRAALNESLAGSCLPKGWKWARLGEICKTTSGGTPSRKVPEYFHGHIPWVKSGELPDGIVTDIQERITDEALANSSAKLFPRDTLLIALYGATVGKLGILKEAAATNQAVCAIFPTEQLSSKYLFWYLRFVRSDLVAKAVGGAQPNISQGILRELRVPVAPVDQQHEIVAEIEKQFSRLDETVSNLHRVKANLKRYKVAVLKAAVEGRLVETEAELARREGRTYESGEQLLQRILETRRSQWNGKGKYKEPTAPDTTDLPELPEGWVWTMVDQLLMSLRNGVSKKPEDSAPGIPILRISAVRALELDTNDSRFYRPQATERIDDYKLEVGDVLFVRYNGTKELVGVCALVNAVSGALLYPDKLIRGRVVREHQVLPSYFAIAANVGKSRQHIDELIKTTAGQQGIAGGEIKQMPLPLPPHTEQQRIVAEVDHCLSIQRELETQVDDNLTRIQRMRQSLLERAFAPEAQ